VKAVREFDAPESCVGCDLALSLKFELYCFLGNHREVGGYADSRHPDCPLKIVPETPEGELKPCPFCGGEAKYFHAYGYHDAQCQNCYAAPFKHSDKEGAIAAWNRREGWL